MGNLKEEINRRRTFAIISHPDAGKTTLTEKFLLYGGAINLAGSVKGKATARHAVSDWMEIEKQRGISVTSSVLQFDVLKFRLESEYNVEIRLEPLPYEHIRWIANKEEVDLTKLVGTSDMKKIKDMKGNPLLLFVNSWSVGMVLDRNKGLELSEFGKN